MTVVSDSRTVKPAGSGRRRILLSAFGFSPNGTMEERNGWQRAMMAAQKFDTTVLYAPSVDLQQLHGSIPDTIDPESVKFVPVKHDSWNQSLAMSELGFYTGYKRWQKKAYRIALQLHHARPFDLTHFVSLCGFREPGYLWNMNIPHVWGPIGGQHQFPKRYGPILNKRNRLRESFRSIINHYQLNYCPRVGLAAKKSKTIIAASAAAQKVFQRVFRRSVELELETGLDYLSRPKREGCDRHRPLRILWAGRLRAWKALPLLLHGISRLPPEVRVELKVLGTGSSEKEWKQLASKLAIQDRIEWIPWPTYRETLPYYDWADVFAFTSLRDTSGTGLLEALAAGCPILGVNHQGAADIMTNECSIPISVAGISSTVQEFSDAIRRCYLDRDYWLRLSHQATEHAAKYEWRSRQDWMHTIYERALQRETI
jgi:glycosyltransferase involved in cell wall biosynthesis